MFGDYNGAFDSLSSIILAIQVANNLSRTDVSDSNKSLVLPGLSWMVLLLLLVV